ncbi:MAG: tetratricopeptide repeat protein [Planctomycetota bacterium]|jgi:tetratricopeptide (TPR) repeat protein
MRGDLDEALKHLEEAVKLDPSSGAAWNNLGNARWRTGAYPDAVEAWQRAWANDPLCDAAGANLRRQQEIDEQ